MSQNRSPVSKVGIACARARKLAGVPEVPLNQDLYRNAALMELGVNDPARIEVQTLR